MVRKINLGKNAMQVLEARYLKKNAQGKVIETAEQMFRRAAKAVAAADRLYGGDAKKSERLFYEMMSSLDFLPNSPTLMNAGTAKQMLSACFVLPVHDSLASIFQTLKDMALVEQMGGGVGFNFSEIRPRGERVASTYGAASGPVSFMRIYNMATEVIRQGSRRRGAMMGMLDSGHGDIMEFIDAKSKKGMLRNFNLSVSAGDRFMKSLSSGKNRKVFDRIAKAAWETGDPGLVFIDEINRKHPLPEKISATNPCGELPLLPYESCNLGSINLARCVCKKGVDWEKLRGLSRLGVHFLDNVIDVNHYPLEKIEHMTKANRKIGLGLMGFADMLMQLGIAYDSEKALKLAERIAKEIRREAEKKSSELAKSRGSFPNIGKSRISGKRRNATLLSIAPTGTISIIANVSSGIEPSFALSFKRQVLEGKELLETNSHLGKALKDKGIYSKGLVQEIAKTGSVRNMKRIPQKLRKVFVTALDIRPEWHVRMQAAFQKHVDNAVSKTVNLPSTATVNDIKKVYMLAYNLKCKGITIYRYGSRDGQVLTAGRHLKAHAEYSGGCPTIECPT